MIKHKLAYLGLLAVFWMVMRLYLFREAAVLFYMLLCFLPLLFLVFRLGAVRMRLSVEIPKQVIKKNEEFCVRLTVRGGGHIPNGPVVVWFWHRNCISEKWNKKKIILDGAGREGYELYARSDYCARYMFRIRRARVYDVFRIFSRRVRVLVDPSLQSGVTVLPEGCEIVDWPVRDNPNVMVESEVYSDTKGGDDVSEIFDIRDYVPGDRFNRIHWKLTSKLDRLMVKEPGLPVDCSVLIFLELSGYDGGISFLKYRDALFCALLSLSECLVAQGQTHYIAWNAADGRNEKYPVTCEEDLYEAIGALLGEPVGHRADNAAAAYLAEYSTDQYTNIFCLLASERPQEEVGVMVELRKSAWLTILLFDGHEAMRTAQKAYPADIDIVYMTPDGAQEEIETAFCRKESWRWQEN